MTADRSRVEFSVPGSAGIGYEFIERRWQLLYSPDLRNWSQIVAEGIADGNQVSHLIEASGESGNAGFYRLQIHLE